MPEDITSTTSTAPAAEPAGAEQATPQTDPSSIVDAAPAPKSAPDAGAKPEPAGEAPKPQEGGEPAKPEADADDQPITDWSKVKLDIPEGAQIDQPVMEAFGKAAVELGLSRTQASKLVNFQLDQIAQAKERLYDAGVKELNKEWGAKSAENTQAVLTLIANVDREMGGSGTEFSKALESCGATLLPAVCKGLLHLAKATSEDSMGRGGAAAQAEHEETAYEGLMNAFKESKGR